MEPRISLNEHIIEDIIKVIGSQKLTESWELQIIWKLNPRRSQFFLKHPGNHSIINIKYREKSFAIPKKRSLVYLITVSCKTSSSMSAPLDELVTVNLIKVVEKDLEANLENKNLMEEGNKHKIRTWDELKKKMLTYLQFDLFYLLMVLPFYTCYVFNSPCGWVPCIFVHCYLCKFMIMRLFF